MPGTFSAVEYALHTDAAVRELGPRAFRLFVWSFSHDDLSSLCGLSEVSPRVLMRLLDTDAAGLQVVLAELDRKPLAVYDPADEVLWCVNRATRLKSHKQHVLAANELDRLHVGPDSPLVRAFTEKYPALARARV